MSHVKALKGDQVAWLDATRRVGQGVVLCGRTEHGSQHSVLSVENPEIHGLMECDPAGRCFVGLYEREAVLWQSSIRCWILGVGFAEELVQLKPLKEMADRSTEKFRGTSVASVFGIPNVQVHVSRLSVDDLIDVTMPNRLAVSLPEQVVELPFQNWSGEVLSQQIKPVLH